MYLLHTGRCISLPLALYFFIRLFLFPPIPFPTSFLFSTFLALDVSFHHLFLLLLSIPQSPKQITKLLTFAFQFCSETLGV